MESSRVQYQVENDIAIITMDDGKANALSPSMTTDLGNAFDRAEKEANAVILTGRPGRFSAGFDLKILMTGPEAAMNMILAGGNLFLRIYEFPKPVIMAVSGHALAGGILLAATGDIRIGIQGDYKIGLNEVQNGMSVPVLAHILASDHLIASELVPSVLHSKIYTPQTAQVAGWLDQVVAPEELATCAMQEATRLAALPGRAYAASKRSLRQQSIEHVKKTLDANVAELTSNLGI